MASLTLSGNGSINAIAAQIQHELQNSALSCTLVDAKSRSIGTAKICTMVFEKYYMRASNRASLTVVLAGEAGTNRIVADIIGSGGGQGPIFSMSWGSENSFVNDMADILKRLGFN